VYSTVSWDSGGYSLQVPAGTYRMVFSGGDLPAPVVRENVVVGSANVLQDVNATGVVGIPTLNTLGTLLITGTAGNDRITVENLADRVRVTLNSATWDLLRKGVKRIEVHGGTGNDTIDIGPALPAARLYGDDGNDTISGGAGNDRIWSGFGDDMVDGRAGRDLLCGEDGADSLLGGDGSDTIYAGAGPDTLRGGAGSDKLRGEDGDDRIEGENGNDRITGGPGSDILIGGAGNDTLNAKDTATDRIVTGLGIDTISRDTLLDIQTTIVP
jgi:Ca2+-binding RTX toxin-like protein